MMVKRICGASCAFLIQFFSAQQSIVAAQRFYVIATGYAVDLIFYYYNQKTKLTRSKVEVLSTRPTRFYLFISSRQIMFNLIILCNLSSKFPSSKTRSAVPDVQTLPQLSRVRHWHSPNTEPRLVTIIRVCLLSICYCGLIIALLSVDEFLLILFTCRCLRLCSGKTWIKNKKYSVGRSSFQKYFHIKFYRNRRD